MVGCSSNPITPMATPILCPMESLCQMPTLQIQQNKDLVLGLEQAISEIAVCQLKIKALEQCIERHNQQKTE
ncbi:Rz1-like lysis system protein LysC [Ursidibacter sp. B-7004-1]